MNSGLKNKSLSAILWDLLGLIGQRGATFIVSIFLARLLTPEDFGIVGIAMVFIGISQGLLDLGFGASLIQKKDNSNDLYSSVFFANVFIGVLLTAMFIVIAPIIADFFSNPEVELVLRWLSFLIFIQSTAIVPISILKRNLNFKVLSQRLIISNVLGGIVGILMALNGFGVFSIVAQQLISTAFDVAFVWVRVKWRPRVLFSLEKINEIKSFSGYVFLDQITSTIFKRLDVLFVGKIFSPAILGYYTRADSLNRLSTNIATSSIQKVFFPVLSSIQDDDSRFNRVYEKVFSVVVFLSFIGIGLAYILSKDIIIGLFGEKWLFSVSIFNIIVFRSINIPLNGLLLNALISKGYAKESFKIGIFRRVLNLLPILIALFFGLIAFLYATVILSYLMTIINIVFVNKYVPLDLRFHLDEFWKLALPFASVFMLKGMFGSELSSHVIESSVFITIYLVFCIIIKSKGFIETCNVIKSVLNRESK